MVLDQMTFQVRAWTHCLDRHLKSVQVLKLILTLTLILPLDVPLALAQGLTLNGSEADFSSDIAGFVSNFCSDIAGFDLYSSMTGFDLLQT